MTELDRLQKILKHYGINNQIGKLVEELEELLIELKKSPVNKNWLRRVCDEVADVEILVEQVKLHYGSHNVVDRIKDHKIARTLYEMELGLDE